jgi:TolA-binding protein
MLSAAIFGCGDGAKDLYETARLEERQNNPEHARKLYQELLKKHPSSELAAPAKERLDALGN